MRVCHSKEKVTLKPRNESPAMRYQPGMSFGDIAAQSTVGSSESEGLSSDGDDVPVGGRLDETLDGLIEQSMMPPFSTPTSSISFGPTMGRHNIILMLQKQQAML